MEKNEPQGIIIRDTHKLAGNVTLPLEKDNALVAEFVGWTHDPVLKSIMWVPKGRDIKFRAWKLSKSNLVYHKDWNWLIDACKKWDNLYRTDDLLKDRSTAFYQGYIDRCDKLDATMSKYEIKLVFERLVNNVRWYFDCVSNGVYK